MKVTKEFLKEELRKRLAENIDGNIFTFTDENVAILANIASSFQDEVAEKVASGEYELE